MVTHYPYYLLVLNARHTKEDIERRLACTGEDLEKWAEAKRLEKP